MQATNPMNNNNQNTARLQNGNNTVPFIYTHQLPYGIRQHICNLLDADQTWRLLGGQFMQLDATQLRLVGQALLRNDSPTGELLNKLDSANMRISDLFQWLNRMGHCRALELLQPYVIEENQAHSGRGNQRQTNTLNTPTPSFNSIQPMNVMSSNEFHMIDPADYQNQNPDEWRFAEILSNPSMKSEQPKRCHKTGAMEKEKQQQPDTQIQDPGDEIVRMACASNRKRTSISDQEVVNQLRLIMQITYNELKQASNDFDTSNILGNGGFASVYRGYWKGTDVAIKRLRCNLVDQALNELTILNSYRIDNILPIYGISIDGPEACLVYQFMANGSLEDRLSCKNGTPPLTWQQRALIAEGVAKGLYYLHTLRDKPLVHGDAKSANVLLDSQFVPKLGDFGLARQVFKGRNPQTENCTHCTVSSIHGTSVYLPPEYLRHKILSPAVDVYSYGIVLLEMATGKRAYDGKQLLIDFVEDELKSSQQGQVNMTLKDHRVVEKAPNELRICFELLLRLGVNCAHRIKKKRPDMGQVLNHFAHFWLSLNTLGATAQLGAPICIDTNLLMSGLATPASNATTRTLTPDLSISQQHDLHLLKVGQLVNQNSNLMSVEEERGSTQQGQAIGNVIQREVSAGQQVEAMIPLLTELGFSPQEGERTQIN